MKKPLRIGFAIALSAALAACINPQVGVRRVGTSSGVGVSERAPEVGTHRVAKGDTLYSIAFRYQLDVQELIAWNQIGEPYTIYPNQRLRIVDPAKPQLEASARPTVAATTPSTVNNSGSVQTAVIPDDSVRTPVVTVPNSTVSSAAVGSPDVAVAAVPDQAPIGTPQTLSPTNSDGLPTGFADGDAPSTQTAPTASGTSVVPAVAPTTAPPAVATSEPALAPELVKQPTLPAIVKPIEEKPATQVANIPAPVAGKNGWGWPAGGKLLSTFSAAVATRQGIDIAGTPGEAVRAAKGGEVVYSGRGIIGYGELIVIKHDDATLTAYGHNRKRLVKEGQKVAQGQTIAELGRDPQGRNMLHFEVRRNGKPIDPLSVLPKR
jgi:lipoprotein NlpD